MFVLHIVVQTQFICFLIDSIVTVPNPIEFFLFLLAERHLNQTAKVKSNCILTDKSHVHTYSITYKLFDQIMKQPQIKIISFAIFADVVRCSSTNSR